MFESRVSRSITLLCATSCTAITGVIGVARAQEATNPFLFLATESALTGYMNFESSLAPKDLRGECELSMVGRAA